MRSQRSWHQQSKLSGALRGDFAAEWTVFSGRLPKRLTQIKGRNLNRLSNLVARVRHRLTKHAGPIGSSIVATLFFASLLLAPALQGVLVAHLTEERLATLRALFVTLGGSMLGATAIGFSVVMLAVQLNFARIPHALFRKLSQDFRLLGYFAATFAFAFVLESLSMLPSAAWAGYAIIVGAWCILLTLALFLAAYRRALERFPIRMRHSRRRRSSCGIRPG